MKLKKGLNKYIFIFAVLLSYFYGLDEKDNKITNAQVTEVGREVKNENIRICSQNIFRLGDKGVHSEKFDSQAEFLVDRIKDAKCEVIALQEIPGNIEQSAQVTEKLINMLNGAMGSGAKFKDILAKSNDSYIRNGLLYNELLLEVHNVRNMYHDSLPRLSANTAPWSYVRGPLMVELRLRDVQKKGLVLINYHLKSKSKGFKDKAGLDFELSRLVSAGGIRERMDDFMKGNAANYVEVLLGDRNSESNSASAMILSGELDLDDFRGSKSCEILDNGVPDCAEFHYSKPSFLPALSSKNQNEGIDLATHRYRNKLSILDEIYISSEDSDRVKSENGTIRAGVEGVFGEGSDHLLSWIEISL
jgi:hypothetical protein